MGEDKRPLAYTTLKKINWKLHRTVDTLDMVSTYAVCVPRFEGKEEATNQPTALWETEPCPQTHKKRY